MNTREPSLWVKGPPAHLALLSILLVVLAPGSSAQQVASYISAESVLNVSVLNCNPSGDLRLGHKACLVCENSEGPVNSTVTWMRNNRAVVGSEPVVCLIVTQADDGTVFSCSTGTQKAERRLSVTIDPCEIPPPLEQEIKSTRRTDVTFTCTIYSRPKLTQGELQWRHGERCEEELSRDNVRYSVTWRPDASTLSIQRVIDSDSRRYCCVVTASVNSSSQPPAPCQQTFLLTVDGEPLPVSAIVAAFVVLALSLLLMAYAHRQVVLKPLLQLSCCLNCTQPTEDDATQQL